MTAGKRGIDDESGSRGNDQTGKGGDQKFFLGTGHVGLALLV